MKKTSKSIRKNILLFSLIIEAIIVLSIALDFVRINFGVGTTQIVVLLLVDIAALVLLTKRDYSKELFALLFCILLFIPILSFAGKIIIFVILLISMIEKGNF